ncbi:MAG: hypothetical protein ACRDRN_19110 [Sciscionella sp.]
MIREDRELLAELAKLNRTVPNLVLGLMDGSVPAEAQITFGQWMAAIGEVLIAHADAGSGEWPLAPTHVVHRFSASDAEASSRSTNWT